MLKIPIVLPNDNGIRSAGKSNECFYCHQKIGLPHKKDCVILNKKVKLKYSFEIEVEMPWSWDNGQILFHRNDGSWCADNALDELEKLSDKLGCLCSVFSAEIISVSDKPPYRKDDKGNIIP